MKNIIKKWWFWVALIILISVIFAIILNIKKQKETEEAFKNMGNSAKEYYEGINNAHSHIDEFSYNRNTGVVEYHPKNK